MKSVTLAKASGEAKEVNIYFSFGYLLLGPIYSIYKGIIARGILLLLTYVAIIWKGCFPLIKKLVILTGVEASKLSFFDKLGEWYMYLLIGLLVVHLLLTFIFPRIYVKKLLKDGFVPYCEIDAQMLVRARLVKVGTIAYLASFNAIDGVQGKIKMGNSKNLAKELEELKELLKEGMLSKDEYETKRAEAIMRTATDKKKK